MENHRWWGCRRHPQRTSEYRIKAQCRTWNSRDIVDYGLRTRRHDVQKGHFGLMAYGFLAGTPYNVRCRWRQVCWNEHMGEVHEGSSLVSIPCPWDGAHTGCSHTCRKHMFL